MDWRLEQLEIQPFLRGVKFHRMKYRAYRPGWDHDHCVACWVKFMEQKSDLEPIETEGFTTTEEYVHGPEYDWVCKTCFEDFKAVMDWTVG